MQEKIKVAVDAMGGDNAPGEIVKGAVDAVNVRKDIQVLLVGKQDMVKEECSSAADRTKSWYNHSGNKSDGPSEN